MLLPEQHQEFDEKGFVRVKGAFSRAEARAMEDQVWTLLGEKYGALRGDSATWPVESVSGLRVLKQLPVFQAIGSAATLDAIDCFLGKSRWQKSKGWGQFGVSFPEDSRWTVPTNWHTDFWFLHQTDAPFGLLVFSFLSDVGPSDGGTAVVAGSHQLVQRFVEDIEETKRHEMLAPVRRGIEAFLSSDPWLAALSSDDANPDRIARFMDKEHVIDGIGVRVCELTGDAGDIIVGHPWLLHAIAPTCGTRPRFMCIARIHAAREGIDADGTDE